MNKRELLISVIAKLRKEAETAEGTLGIIHKAVVDAPGAMQSHSDTTKFQMSGLGEELQGSVTSKKKAIETLEKMSRTEILTNPSVVCIGSIVEVEDDEGKHIFYFILPGIGGIEIEDDTRKILVVSHSAPLAQSLLQKGVGGLIWFPDSNNPKKKYSLLIVSLQ